MKRCTTLLLLFICTASGAQPYRSIFGDSSTVWSMLVYPSIAPADKDHSSTATFYVEKDTVVDGRTYKKVATSLGLGYNNFLLREDLDSGIVWYRHLRTAGDNVKSCVPGEIVYMNYNWAVGDTVRYRADWPLYYDLVDSVYTENGRKHIRFAVVAGNREDLEAIEGIGLTVGFSYTSACLYNHFNPGDREFFHDFYMLCVKHDGVLIHQNTRYGGDCQPYPPLAIPENRDEEQTRLFPNPVTDKLTITRSNQEPIAGITITDMQGRRLFQENGQTLKNSKIEINTGSWQPGIYFVQITEQSGRVEAFKLLKANE